MTETANLKKTSHLPDTSTQIVRQRWLELLDSSYTTGRVTSQEIEPGVNAVVVTATCRQELSDELIEAELRVASGNVPSMARGVRFALEQAGPFVTTAPTDYDGWMGNWGKEIAAGTTQVSLFVDLAYLEAALLARLWDHGVIVEFGSPLAFFRRGALTDYADVYEAAISMATSGRSLADIADQLAAQILSRLQRYANAYLKLSTLYAHASWQIERDNFVIKIPDANQSLVFQYWQLRDERAADSKTIREWRSCIEEFLHKAMPGVEDDISGSFAA